MSMSDGVGFRRRDSTVFAQSKLLKAHSRWCFVFPCHRAGTGDLGLSAPQAGTHGRDPQGLLRAPAARAAAYLVPPCGHAAERLLFLDGGGRGSSPCLRGGSSRLAGSRRGGLEALRSSYFWTFGQHVPCWAELRWAGDRVYSA